MNYGILEVIFFNNNGVIGENDWYKLLEFVWY